MGIGLLLAGLILWLLFVYVAAYAVGGMFGSSVLAISVWISGVTLPLLRAFLSIELAVAGALAAGVAYWSFRKAFPQSSGGT